MNPSELLKNTSFLPWALNDTVNLARAGSAIKSIMVSPVLGVDTTPFLPTELSLPLGPWWITFDCDACTADRIVLPLTINYTAGFWQLKKPIVSSYKPGATVTILIRSSSQMKFSGQVLTDWTSHGTAKPLGDRLPECQSHLAAQFSATRVWFIFYCSKSLVV